MLIKYALWFYLSYAGSIIIHELYHLIAAVMLKIRVQGVYIGDRLLRLRIGRLYISPIIMSGGYIEVESGNYRGMSLFQICIFFLSGVLGNIVLILLSYYYVSNFALKYWIISVNSLSIILSLLPIYPDNDVLMIFQLWRNKQRFKSF